MARRDGGMVGVEDVRTTVTSYAQAFDLTAPQVDLDHGSALVQWGQRVGHGRDLNGFPVEPASPASS